MTEASVGSSPLRVLHVISNLDIGGAQEVVRSLAPAQAAAGAQVQVATLRDGPLRSSLESSGLQVRVIGERRRSLVRDPRAAAELHALHAGLARLVDEHRVDVVQTHLLRSLDFLSLLLRRRPSHPSIIWTFHNARLDLRPDQVDQRWLLGPKRAAYRLLYRRASRLAGALVAVSTDVEASLRARLGVDAPVVTIPNGVDVDRYVAAEPSSDLRQQLAMRDDELLVVCVAKLHEQKGHRHLIGALGRMAGAGGSVRVALLGDGPLRRDLEKAAAEAGHAGRVHFLGNRADIPAVLAAADAFVLPSLWEGLPMALLEAMAAGLPVVATSVSGTRQVVEDGRTGVLVPPGDEAALATALSRVAGDAELRRRLGAAGREHVQAEYSVSRQAQRHLELYRKCRGLGVTEVVR